MISIYLQLLVHVSVAIMLSSIDNGKSKSILGPEELVTDFAILTGNTLGKLSGDFTICSSVDSRAPFQLLYENGKPWISVHFKSVQKDSRHHRMIFFVSTSTRPNIKTFFKKLLTSPTSSRLVLEILLLESPCPVHPKNVDCSFLIDVKL